MSSLRLGTLGPMGFRHGLESFGLGQTQTRDRAYYERECQRLLAAGEKNPYACMVARSSGVSTEELKFSTPEQDRAAAVARAVERDRQAQAEREAIARKMAEAGLNSKLQQAAREGRDVQYVRAQAFYSQELARQEQEQQARQRAEQDAALARVQAAQRAQREIAAQQALQAAMAQQAAALPRTPPQRPAMDDPYVQSPMAPWSTFGIVAGAGLVAVTFYLLAFGGRR